MSGWRVPFVDPREHYRRYAKEIDGAIHDCLVNGDLIHRRQLFSFERNLAAYVGTRDAAGLNSGYHALLFGLQAVGVKPGDEVITVAHTFAATVSAIVHCGATPVLVEVLDDFTMDPKAAAAAVTAKTKALLPVHLNGRVCRMDPIMELARQHNLAVIEDACQALGATYKGTMGGSFAHGCFSFYPFKALGGFGDGGALTTNDPAVARHARLMRYNGEDRETGDFHFHGHTALLDNVQAAVLDAKLKLFPGWVEHRRAMADRYRQALAGVPELKLPHFPEPEHRDAFQNYVVRADKREALRDHLQAAGVETLVSFARPMWSHKGLELGTPHLPFSERLCREVLSLPMSAETTPEHVDITAAEIRKFYGR